MSHGANGGSAREAHLVVRGRVQGVGFRWSLQHEAQSLGVVGWVRNRPDGTVEAGLQGPEQAVQQVVDWARTGPPGSWVSSVDVDWVEGATPATSFEIVG